MYDKLKIATGKIKPISAPKVEVPIGDSNITVTEPDEIAETMLPSYIFLKPTDAY
jgi:hypothetical protein